MVALWIMDISVTASLSSRVVLSLLKGQPLLPKRYPSSKWFMLLKTSLFSLIVLMMKTSLLFEIWD